MIDSDITSDSGISELTPLLVQESGSVTESSFISEPNTPKGPEPTAESIGLKESIEECMKIPEPTSKYYSNLIITKAFSSYQINLITFSHRSQIS